MRKPQKSGKLTAAWLIAACAASTALGQEASSQVAGFGRYEPMTSPLASGLDMATESEASLGMAAAAPRSPSGLAATDGGDGQSVNLTWVDRSSRETGFTVNRQKYVNGRWSNSTNLTVGANITTLSDSPGPGRYRYRVRSFDTSGASSYSLWATITISEPSGAPPAAAPNAPSGLTLSPLSAGESIRVTWTDNSTNETGFELVRQTRVVVNGVEDFIDWIVFPQAAGVTTFDDEPGPGTYRYMVRSLNPSGQSAYTAWSIISIGVAVPGGPVPPAPPLGLSVQAESNGGAIVARWQDQSSNETAFHVVREQQSGTAWGNAATFTVGANGTSYADIPGSGTFRYKVSAVNDAGESSFTPPAMITVSPPASVPAAPSSLTATAQGTNVTIAWADNASNETGYELIRQTRVVVGGVEDYEAWIQFPLGANTTTFSDDAGEGTFRYMVRAMGAGGNSAYTAWVYVTVGAPNPPSVGIPTAPSGVAGADAGNGRALVTWTDNSNNETSFELERNPAFSGGNVLLGADQTTYINDTGDGTFSYRVRAVNSAGASAYTAWAQATIASSGGGSNPPPPPPPPTGGGTGWTDLTPPAGARVVYVSSSTGNNSNTGLSASTPVRTISAGMALLRDGSADQMLLKKGDTWTGEEIDVSSKTGQSATARIVIGSYGTGARPKVTAPGGSSAISRVGGSRGNLVLSGIHFVPSSGDEYNSPALIWVGGPSFSGKNILIEDCRFARFFRGMELQDCENVVVRRCVFEDICSRSGSGYSPMAVYVGLTRGILVEENFIVNKAFTTVRAPYQQDSQTYLQDENEGSIIVRRNIYTSKGGQGPLGIAVRSSGTIEDNFLDGMHTGIHVGGQDTPPSGRYPNGTHYTVRGNVISRLVNMTNQAGGERGIGIQYAFFDTAGTLIENNIISNKTVSTDGTGLNSDPAHYGPTRNATIRGNILYNANGIQFQRGSYGTSSGNVVENNVVQNPGSASAENALVNPYATGVATWRNNTYFSNRAAGTWFQVDYANRSNSQWQSTEPTAVFQQVSFPAPTRDLLSYASTQGVAANWDAVAAVLLNQSKDTWDSRFTIDALLGYVRDGFGVTSGAP